MEFAFSPDNPGFVGGNDGGLGSGHTPGAWPLGHVQAWLVGVALGDEPAAAAALDRLQRAAFADGMLPEASVFEGAAMIPIRHWFAWPGAALGAFWLLDRRGTWDALAARRVEASCVRTTRMRRDRSQPSCRARKRPRRDP